MRGRIRLGELLIKMCKKMKGSDLLSEIRKLLETVILIKYIYALRYRVIGHDSLSQVFFTSNYWNYMENVIRILILFLEDVPISNLGRGKYLLANTL